MSGARCASIAVLLLAVTAGEMKGQAGPLEEEVRKLRAAISDLDQKLAASQQRQATITAQARTEGLAGGDAQKQAESAKAAQNMKLFFASLNEQVSLWKAREPAAELAFAKGISQYREALQSLPSDQAKAEVVLQAIADDAMLKSEHCRAAGGAATVEAQVRTIRRQQEVPGWAVYYLPRFLASSPTAKPDRFPRISSPTSEDLAPGNYYLWAVDPQSKASSERVPARVGGKGSNKVVIDLPLP